MYKLLTAISLSGMVVFNSLDSLAQKAINQYDVVIYGGNAAGVIAGIEAAKKNKSVVIIEPSNRIGGLTTGGLGDTDIGDFRTIGGLAKEFYNRIGAGYGIDSAVWRFEPKIALIVFQKWLAEYKIPVIYHERLNLKNGVHKLNNHIAYIVMESGKAYGAKVFIDASYEGDLMAGGKVSYFVGREANSAYKETYNGFAPGNGLPKGIDPYKIKGEPMSGLLDRVNPNLGGNIGDGNKMIQAYGYRMCLTDDPLNRIMIEKPNGYKESDYEILFRAIEQGQTRRFFKLVLVSSHKTDSNNDSGVSTDYIGMNWNYADGDYKLRLKIAKAHEIYQKGLVWTLQNHPRVPMEIREFYNKWGLPKDEFLENNHWPGQLYIRESRRMVSDFVVTQDVVVNRVGTKDPVGLGSYAIDSHHTQYYVGDDGFVSTEGGFYHILNAPYQISYKALVPKKSECNNLIVPVCVSATHAAYGSIRMEPVFMILGQAAADAVAIAIDNKVDIQDVKYLDLQKMLIGGNQILN